MITLLFFVELVFLYFLSRHLTQKLYELFILVFRARSVAVMLVTLLHFPGTVIHELSHLFTAEVLGVHTGKLTLVPEDIRGVDIQAGSVMVAETGPFRRYAIGLAPVFAGTVALVTIAYFLPGLVNAITGPTITIHFWQNPSFYLLVLAGYLMYAISNSMFSSPQDLKGFAPFAITVSIFLLAGYLLGLRLTLTGQALSVVDRVLLSLVQSVGLVLALNVILLLLTHAQIALITKITHRKIIREFRGV